MREYELMVIINPEVDDRAVEPTLKKFLEVVTRENGTVDNVDIWGRRRLAYEIQKKSEGIYAVVRFHAEPSTSQELDRVLNLNEAIMRTKIIRPEEQRIHPHHDVNGEVIEADAEPAAAEATTEA